jgi:CRP-like cAMP-binding protein
MAVQGTAGRQFAVVLAGELRVARDGIELARLGPGSWCGELALMRGHAGRSTATVDAVVDGELLVFSRQEFDALRGAAPTVDHRISAAAVARLLRLVVQ